MQKNTPIYRIECLKILLKIVRDKTNTHNIEWFKYVNYSHFLHFFRSLSASTFSFDLNKMLLKNHHKRSSVFFSLCKMEKKKSKPFQCGFTSFILIIFTSHCVFKEFHSVIEMIFSLVTFLVFQHLLSFFV